MKIAIMQPYFFPYIGYFQLMAAVDKFILLDDVNYIKRGWINRNRVIVNNQTTWLTLPLICSSQNRLIKEIEIQPDAGWKRKMLNTVKQSYCRAEYKGGVFPLFESLIDRASGNLSDFLCTSLNEIHHFLDLKCKIVPSSGVYIKNGLTGAARILDICLKEQATHYINPPGGEALYDSSDFEKENVQLHFLQPRIPNLECCNMETGALSILHLLMLMDKNYLQKYLYLYDLK